MLLRHVLGAALAALTLISVAGLRAQEPAQVPVAVPGVEVTAPGVQVEPPAAVIAPEAAVAAPAAEVQEEASVGDVPAAVVVEGEGEAVAEGVIHPLDELGWLVGEWRDEDEDVQIETRYQWAKNGAFLVNSFRVTAGDGEPLSGMQIIGWDGARQTIRSWTYDSDGGFGEATWKKEGDRWTIKSNFTTADGDKAHAINMLKYVNDEQYTWRSVNREVGGEILPDIEETVVVRANVGVEPEAAGAGVEAIEPSPSSGRRRTRR